jgi:LysR family transcriptional regulator, transcriptional activator of the cysJI operon
MLIGFDDPAAKAFYFAARTLNFTEAANQAAMTQSGVSQHVANLEERFSVQLFSRVKRNVLLTEAVKILLRHLEDQKTAGELLEEKLRGETKELKGLVRYAMPHSCLFTPHFPILLDARREFPGVDIRVDLCPNEEVVSRVLNFESDFGFVTAEVDDGALDAEHFAREEYVLVSANDRGHDDLTRDQLLSEPWVSWPGMDNLFSQWWRGHFPRSHVPSSDSLRIAGRINSLQAAITMIEHGIGLSVVPKHCVESGLKSKVLRELKLGKLSTTSDIFIVSVAGVDHPKRVKCVLETFRAMKKV